MHCKHIGLSYQLKWPYRYLRAPKKNVYIDPESLPKKILFLDTNELIEDELSITFLGDFMGVGSKDVYIDDELKSFLHSSEKIVFNLESVVLDSNKTILSKQHTHPLVFKKFMSQLITSKVLVGIANNHIYDFGINGMIGTINAINESGANYFGTINRPKILLGDGLAINASTFWKNKYDKFVNVYNKTNHDEQVIEFVHWGQEFLARPCPSQEKIFQDLPNTLCVIGHHSHTPQPIYLSNNILTAYSLGNFVTYFKSEKINNGLFLNLKLVKIAGDWKIFSSEWDFIHIKVKKSYSLITRGN